MSRQRQPETFSEFKAQRIQILAKIEYHKGQESYHRASARAYQEKLEEFDRVHPSWRDNQAEEKRLANRESQQQIDREMMIDKKELERRVTQRKAEEMYRHLMKGFK